MVRLFRVRGAERQIMSSPLIVPLALFAAVTFILTILKAARIPDIEAEIRRRLHHEQTEHQRMMNRLEADLQRIKQWKSSSLGALNPQNEQ